MSTKHTPESWSITHTTRLTTMISDKEGVICEIYGYDRVQKSLLIAAAPEMLELLKTLHELGGLGYEKHRRIESLINKVTQP